MPTSSTLDAVGNIQYSVPYPQNENQWIGRLDSPLSPKNSVFARYFLANYSAHAQYGGHLLNTVNPHLIDRDKNLTLADNFTFAPQLTNALRLTGTRLAVQRNSAPTVPNLASLVPTSLTRAELSLSARKQSLYRFMSTLLSLRSGQI